MAFPAPEAFTYLVDSYKLYYEHDVYFESRQNEAREEEALHMLRLAKVTRLVSNR